MVAVSCNGDVRPCAHNPFSYGNLLEEDLRDIWQKMSDWRSAQYVPESCLDCTWLNRCNGGCRTSAKAFNGDWNKNDMWGTGKLAVTPPNNDNPVIELKPDTRLQFTPNLQARKDDEEAYVVYNATDDVFFMVNQAYYDFIMGLKEQGSFSFGALCETNHISPDNPQIQDIITFLIKKKVLKIIDKPLN